MKTTDHDAGLKIDFIKVALILSKDVWHPADVQLPSYLTAEFHWNTLPKLLMTSEVPSNWHYVKIVDSSEFSTHKNLHSFKNISSFLTLCFLYLSNRCLSNYCLTNKLRLWHLPWRKNIIFVDPKVLLIKAPFSFIFSSHSILYFDFSVLDQVVDD